MPTDDRSPYTVTINEIPHTMLLVQEHADHYGDAAVPLDEGTIDPPPEDGATKAKAPANKASTPPNKGR